MPAPDTDWVQLTEDRLKRLEGGIAENTEITREVRDIVQTGRALFRFGEGFGRFVGWAARVAGAGAAIWAIVYAATHGGKPPGH